MRTSNLILPDQVISHDQQISLSARIPSYCHPFVIPPKVPTARSYNEVTAHAGLQQEKVNARMRIAE
jgi:hypothetical protein